VAKRGATDRLAGLAARLTLLRQSDAAAATAFAIELVAAERGHRVLEPALKLLAERAPTAAREPLRGRFADLDEVGDRFDQDCALRVGIVRALRAIDSRRDQDIAEAAIATVQINWTNVDLAQPLRAEGLLLLAEIAPERASYRAVELLADRHVSPFSGEPTLTAVRVLMAQGQLLPIWGVVQRADLPADVLAQAFASMRRAPRDLLLNVIRAHLSRARDQGEVGEAVALVAAEAIVLHELTEAYDEVVELLEETPNLNLFRYLALVAAREGALRARLEELRRRERDESRLAALDAGLGARAPASPWSGQ
jgi:hypothetical protein